VPKCCGTCDSGWTHYHSDNVLQAAGGIGGTIAVEHIVATGQFDDYVTGTLLHDYFNPGRFTGATMGYYVSEGGLFRHGDKALWLGHPQFVPDEGHDRRKTLAPIYPEHYGSKKGASPDG